MSYLDKSTDATVVSIKITDKGRELLARGLQEDDNFDIIKYSFGDSEINYNIDDEDIETTSILEPSTKENDLVSKIYVSGVVPSGTSTINISTTEIDMNTNESGVHVSVYTEWPPIEGIFNEEYKWTNLGPLNDWDFGLSKSIDTKVANIRTYDVVGTTRIKVKGLTSGRYAVFTLKIS